MLEEVILERQAVKRLLEPAEVAGTSSRFCSAAKRSRFTGSPVVMDLGWTARILGREGGVGGGAGSGTRHRAFRSPGTDGGHDRRPEEQHDHGRAE